MNKLIITLCLVSQLALAESKECKDYVKACEETIAAQDKAIDNLKKSVKILKEELADAEKQTPSWVLIVGGIAVGVILNSTLRR
jgi:hypothetical protein